MYFLLYKNIYHHKLFVRCLIHVKLLLMLVNIHRKIHIIYIYLYKLSCSIFIGFFCSSVQMRLYALSKRQFVMVYIVFFICFGISVLVGVADRTLIKYTKYRGSSHIMFVVDQCSCPFPTNLHPHERIYQHLFNIYENCPDYTTNEISFL